MSEPAYKLITAEQAMNSNRLFWQGHNGADGFPEHYPDEEVVRFLCQLKGSGYALDAPLLDLASGSGKNALAMLEMGFTVACVDWAESGLAYTRQRAVDYEANLSCQVHDFTTGRLPYPSQMFKAVVAIQAFDHVFRETAESLLRDLSRVMQPGGLLLASLMTDNTSKASRRGVAITGEPDAELVDSGNSAGEIHRFSCLAELPLFFAPYFEVKQTLIVNAEDKRTGERVENVYLRLERH